MSDISVFDEIKGISNRVLVSDMPDRFIAEVTSASRHIGTYGKNLKLELQTKDDLTFNIFYRIPKVLTGKGQLDQLMASLKQLNQPLEEIIGKTFEWQRKELSGTMKGNPRHYPIRLATEAKTE